VKECRGSADWDEWSAAIEIFGLGRKRKVLMKNGRLSLDTKASS
jgi:hypothetical protein